MALEGARAGDVLTVWRLDRLGRSLHDLILFGRKLDELGIGLMSVQEKIDTSSSGGRLVFASCHSVRWNASANWSRR